jgi:tripartite-type tricarboxylate transporter receptor subunit TctC
MAGLDMVHVPFRGAAPAMTALLGGFIDMSFSDPLATLPMLSTGRVRALAVSGAHRLKTAPEVPTVAEAGLPGYAVSSWLGIVGPAGLAPDRIALLNTAINNVLSMPEVQARLSAQGAEAFPGTPEELGTFMREEAARWKRVIEAGNLSIAN